VAIRQIARSGAMPLYDSQETINRCIGVHHPALHRMIDNLRLAHQEEVERISALINHLVIRRETTIQLPRVQVADHHRAIQRLLGATTPRLVTTRVLHGATALHLVTTRVLHGAAALHLVTTRVLHGAAALRLVTTRVLHGAAALHLVTIRVLHGAAALHLVTTRVLHGAAALHPVTIRVLRGAAALHPVTIRVLHEATTPHLEVPQAELRVVHQGQREAADLDKLTNNKTILRK